MGVVLWMQITNVTAIKINEKSLWVCKSLRISGSAAIFNGFRAVGCASSMIFEQYSAMSEEERTTGKNQVLTFLRVKKKKKISNVLSFSY